METTPPTDSTCDTDHPDRPATSAHREHLEEMDHPGSRQRPPRDTWPREARQVPPGRPDSRDQRAGPATPYPATRDRRERRAMPVDRVSPVPTDGLVRQVALADPGSMVRTARVLRTLEITFPRERKGNSLLRERHRPSRRRWTVEEAGFCTSFFSS